MKYNKGRRHDSTARGDRPEGYDPAQFEYLRRLH
jgi:hypothetical protein